MIERQLSLHFAIDTNRINSRERLPNMNRLEAWAASGLIEIVIPQTAYEEALKGSDLRRRRKTSLRIITVDTAQSSEEDALRRRLEQILFPGGARTQNQVNDVAIVFNSHKYGCSLITADGGSKSQSGGILGHRDDLWNLGIRVMTDAEAVVMVEQWIRRRDEAAILSAAVHGEDPPAWVGVDS